MNDPINEFAMTRDIPLEIIVKIMISFLHYILSSDSNYKA